MAPEAVDEYVNYYLGNNQALLMVQHSYADAVFEVRILNILFDESIFCETYFL